MPYNECHNCPLHTCDYVEADYECWIDVDPTQDVQELWEYLGIKYSKETGKELMK